MRDELIGRPDGPDVEPPEVSWLRAYSNYLTPRVGIGSADAWTAIALYARNLLLNWLVILPVLCLALFGLKFIATASVAVARVQSDLVAGRVDRSHRRGALIVAQAFTTSHRPVRREKQPDPLPGEKPKASPHNIRQRTFITRDLSWSVLSAIAFTLSLCSWWATAWIDNSGRGVDADHLRNRRRSPLRHRMDCRTADLAPPSRTSPSGSPPAWFTAPLIGLGAYLFALLQPYAEPTDFKLSLPIVFGIPWVLMSQLIAEMIFVGLVSYEDRFGQRPGMARARRWLDKRRCDRLGGHGVSIRRRRQFPLSVVLSL